MMKVQLFVLVAVLIFAQTQAAGHEHEDYPHDEPMGEEHNEWDGDNLKDSKDEYAAEWHDDEWKEFDWEDSKEDHATEWQDNEWGGDGNEWRQNTWDHEMYGAGNFNTVYIPLVVSALVATRFALCW